MLSESAPAPAGLTGGDRPSPLFDLFWSNSALNRVTVHAFRRGVDEFARALPPAPALAYPGADIPLPLRFDRLAETLRSRRSTRSFDARLLPGRSFERLFSAFAHTGGSAAYASAGATYAVDVFALANVVTGKLNRTAVYYNRDTHSLAHVRSLPPWRDYAEILNFQGCEGTPHVVFVFVLFPDRTTAKYGERGGRFALIEVGHAAQNLVLRAARDRIGTCELGGLYDDAVKGLLGLQGTNAKVALGVACGLPRATPWHARLRAPFARAA